MHFTILTLAFNLLSKYIHVLLKLKEGKSHFVHVLWVVCTSCFNLHGLTIVKFALYTCISGSFTADVLFTRQQLNCGPLLNVSMVVKYSNVLQDFVNSKSRKESLSFQTWYIL